jgi:hypothetical protein
MLLPFAWRLKKDGHEVDVLVRKGRFENCWGGKLPKILRGVQKGETGAELQALVEATVQAEAVVLTDSKAGMRAFNGYPRLWGIIPEESAIPFPPLSLGAWFDGAEWSGHHLIVEDKGLWPGGLGPHNVPGGLTLIRHTNIMPTGITALETVGAELKARDFRGLVKVGLQLSPEDPWTADSTIVGFQAGWPFLHTHAFVADQEDFGSLFTGAPAALPSRFTVALPLSVPPWPLGGVRADRQCNIPVAKVPIPRALIDSGQVFFTDMEVKDGAAWTAGADGLVGVARGSAQGFELARLKAMRLAQVAVNELPDAQVRLDVGARVPAILAGLEEAGLLV